MASKLPSASDTGVRKLSCNGREVVLDRTRIMGILNLTPDSFSDGGRWRDAQAAVEHAMAMQEAGADIIDVGGESTRPGAQAIGVQQELDRVLPVIEALAPMLAVPLSIDTGKPEVMRAAVAAGAGMINDVYALRQDGALQAAADLAVPVCLMHMLGNPRVMQNEPVYDEVAGEVAAFLLERAALCESNGIASGDIVLDPGFGFGKNLQQNIALFGSIGDMAAMGYPLLVGVSRKSMLGQLTGRDTGDRLAASVTAAVLAAQMGAAIVRVHDVAETRDALEVATALWPGWA
jgi:dihydropteroate synthase